MGVDLLPLLFEACKRSIPISNGEYPLSCSIFYAYLVEFIIMYVSVVSFAHQVVFINEHRGEYFYFVDVLVSRRNVIDHARLKMVIYGSGISKFSCRRFGS